MVQLFPFPQNRDDMDEEEIDQLDETFDEDHEVHQTIRSDIIPKVVLWCTDEANDDVPDDFGLS